MAIRNILRFGDEILNKKCREVTAIDSRLITLLDDLRETLHDANGAGLAAPQVGVLKRVAIVDIGDEDGTIELINPKIVKTWGSVNDLEGCLSLPGKYGYVVRPKKVKVEALDRNGKKFEIIGEDLKARALCHEIEHLDGILYTTHVTEFVDVEGGDEE